jgi:translation initiation factor 2B subunit (eIF-2B alpha/beta/delta family)
MILQWLEAQAWKLTTAAASATAIGLAVALVIAQAQHHTDEKTIKAQALSIDSLGDSLDQCRVNTATLEGAVRSRNAEIDRQATEGKKRLEAAEKGLKEAQAATLAAERRVGVLLRPLAGADSCARMAEMDARILEDLK